LIRVRLSHPQGFAPSPKRLQAFVVFALPVGIVFALPVDAGHLLEPGVGFLVEFGEFGEITPVFFHVAVLVMSLAGGQLGGWKAEKLDRPCGDLRRIREEILGTQKQYVLFWKPAEPALQLQIIETAADIGMVAVGVDRLARGASDAVAFEFLQIHSDSLLERSVIVAMALVVLVMGIGALDRLAQHGDEFDSG